MPNSKLRHDDSVDPALLGDLHQRVTVPTGRAENKIDAGLKERASPNNDKAKNAKLSSSSRQDYRGKVAAL